jgi:ATP adenylyltransferase/5',5'''-P-1,P-4-tetraphosphate phosphorylase II
MKAPFSSLEVFREQFNLGLHKLAEQGGFGPFILACANAVGDQKLLNDIRPQLQNQYQELYELCRNAFAKGRNVDVVDEDLLVFLKLHAIGFESVRESESRREGVWKIQFNHLRSFRPKRIAQFVHLGAISEPFNEDRFNFNKPFMARECFWRGELLGRNIDLFYNKYPFADLHGLLVVDRQDGLPQLLELDDHQYVFALCEALEDRFKGVGFGYNSYGAYASVNHLHFQMFVDAEHLPVTDAQWQHNGGTKTYPANCYAFDTSSAAWNYIQTLHKSSQPYNVLYVPGRIFVFPRKTQGTVDVPTWSSGFTWYELSGGFVVFNRDDYKNLRAENIEHYLQQLRIE